MPISSKIVIDDPLSHLIGLKYSEDLLENIDYSKKRVGPVGMVFTQDYNTSRLNILYDDDMVIKRAFWG